MDYSELRRVFGAYHLSSRYHRYAFDECMVEPCPSARRLLELRNGNVGPPLAMELVDDLEEVDHAVVEEGR